MYLSPPEQNKKTAEMIIMATATLNPTFSARGTTGEHQNSGFLANLASRFVEQRIAKARQHTANYVAGMSDEKLASFGWNEQEIQRLRRG